MKLRLYKDSEHQWRWSVLDKANGKIMADCGQGYSRKRDCLSAFEKVTNTATLQMMRNEVQTLLNRLDRITEGHVL